MKAALKLQEETDLPHEQFIDVCEAAFKPLLEQYDKGPSPFHVPLGTLLPTSAPLYALLGRFNNDHFPKTKAHLNRNYDNIRFAFIEDPGEAKLETPTHYQWMCMGTAFDGLERVRVPVHIPEDLWFRHCSIWATHGRGKTFLLQSLIFERLLEAMDDKCSVFVMDSQGSQHGSLIHSITNLKIFAPGENMHGQLIFIEPDRPYAMNPFVIGKDRSASYSPAERRRLRSKTIELLTSMFTAQKVDFTSHQNTMLSFCIELLFETPNPTIYDLYELVSIGEGKLGRFQQYVPKLRQIAQDFFNTQFAQKNFVERAKDVAGRLVAILRDESMEALFREKECRLDFFEQLNQSKIVVVDTTALGKHERELYGRFMISLLLRAAEERLALPPEQRKPIYAFIDESNDYIRTDPNIETIISKQRKNFLSLTCANQHTGQIDEPSVLQALLSASIKFASTNLERDVHMLAGDMGAKQDPYILKQPKHHFALSIDGERPISVKADETLSAMDWMERSEFTQIKAEMDETYGPRKQTRYPEAKPFVLHAAEDPDDPMTGPS